MTKFFSSAEYVKFTNTCKFWKFVAKDPKLQECFITYTPDSMASEIDINGKLTHYYFNIDMLELIEINGGWNRWDVQLIEECEWEDKDNAQHKVKELVASFPSATSSAYKHLRTKDEQLLHVEQLRLNRQKYLEQNHDQIITKHK